MKWALPGALTAGLLVACQGSNTSGVDDELLRMIHQRQVEALGSGNRNDPQIMTPSTTPADPGAEAYNTHLQSAYPPAAELPAATAPTTTQPSVENIHRDASTQPAGAREMNLEQALAQAIAGSPDYRTQKEQLLLASLDLLIQKHLWGPQFFDTLTNQATGTPEAGDHTQAYQLLNDLGVTQQLPYGGTIAADALVNYTRALHTLGDAPNSTTEVTTLNASITLPLLRGAGEVAREDLIQAERTLSYTARSFESYRGQFLLNVSSQFYGLVLQQAQLDNLRRQLENFQWLQRRTEALAVAGRVPFFQVQQAEQQALFAANNLLNAEEAYASSLDALKLTLGLDIETRVVIVPSAVEVPLPVLDPVAAMATALQNRLDLRNAQDQVEDARRKVAVAKNQLLPDLNLVGNVSLPTNPLHNIGALNLHPGAGTYTAGVVMNLPLDRRAEQLNYRKALITLEQTQRSYTLLRDQVAQQVRSSIRQIELAQFTLELQNRNIEVADKRLRGVLLQLAKLAILDFIDAQSDLLTARNLRDSAVRDVRVNVLQYLLNTGQLRVDAAGQWLPPAKLVPLPPPATQPSDPQRLLGQTTAPAASPAGPATRPAAGPVGAVQ